MNPVRSLFVRNRDIQNRYRSSGQAGIKHKQKESAITFFLPKTSNGAHLADTERNGETVAFGRVSYAPPESRIIFQSVAKREIVAVLFVFPIIEFAFLHFPHDFGY